MNERQRYQTVDLPFYRSEIAPILPDRILDFHAHTWRCRDWQKVPWQAGVKGAKYMVTTPDYPIEQLRKDGQTSFPDRPYSAVCFGAPMPAADLDKTNAYSLSARRHKGLFPLIVTGRDRIPPDRLRAMIAAGFFGFKVILNWQGNNYSDVTVADMIGPAEMKLADEIRLVVLLHVPRSERLADPAIQKGVQALSRRYPRSQIVLAHCGRCYTPDEMRDAIRSIQHLDNVYLDTSMVMDPTVLEIVFDRIASRRVLFATDFPVAAMRGRRVYVMDHWVDIVLEGYEKSDYRLASNGIRATFMSWEIALAVRRAAERVGLSHQQLRAIFHANGMAVLDRVKR